MTEMNSPSPHRLSPSFTDSAIDVEELSSTDSVSNSFSAHIDSSIIVPVSSSSAAYSINERISHIAAAAQRGGFSADDHVAINKCLDGLESLLLDPRPGISRVIALNRPVSPSSRAATPTPATFTTAAPPQRSTKVKEQGKAQDGEEQEAEEADADERWEDTAPISIACQTPRSNPIPIPNQSLPSGLESVLRTLTSVNEELQQRYLESRHIHDLFIVKCEGLAQRIIALEAEVHELKSDVLEDTIELEGLRGTIRGLESWVSRWQRQREDSTMSPTPNPVRRAKGSSWRWRRKQAATNHAGKGDDKDDDDDFDTFLDGVLAWMRGWNDVEEGFLIRARRRKMRRERTSTWTT